MATTNVDIVKISQLTQMDRLTDDDHLLVNDHDPSTGLTETKKIFINDLSADIAGRVQLMTSTVSPSLVLSLATYSSMTERTGTPQLTFKAKAAVAWLLPT